MSVPFERLMEYAASLTEDYGTLIENSVLTASGTAAYPLTVFGSTGAASSA